MDNTIVEFKESTPPSIFEKPVESKSEKSVTTVQKINDVVGGMMQQAVVHVVKTDDVIKDKVVGTAKKAIDNKMNAIVSETELEDKKTHFDNNLDVVNCFGYHKVPIDKWAVNIMKYIYNVMTVIWIILATFTLMPIVFIGKKINNAIKSMWLAMILALIIYGMIVAAPFIINLLGGK